MNVALYQQNTYYDVVINLDKRKFIDSKMRLFTNILALATLSLLMVSAARSIKSPGLEKSQHCVHSIQRLKNIQSSSELLRLDFKRITLSTNVTSGN